MLLKFKCVLFQNLVKTKHTAIIVVAVSVQFTDQPSRVTTTTKVNGKARDTCQHDIDDAKGP